MVVDSKQSKVSRATRKYERTALPRVLDVVQDGLTLLDIAEWLRSIGQEAELEYVIADFRDAFS